MPPSEDRDMLSLLRNLQRTAEALISKPDGDDQQSCVQRILQLGILAKQLHNKGISKTASPGAVLDMYKGVCRVLLGTSSVSVCAILRNAARQKLKHLTPQLRMQFVNAAADLLELSRTARIFVSSYREPQSLAEHHDRASKHDQMDSELIFTASELVTAFIFVCCQLRGEGPQQDIYPTPQQLQQGDKRRTEEAFFLETPCKLCTAMDSIFQISDFYCCQAAQDYSDACWDGRQLLETTFCSPASVCFVTEHLVHSLASVGVRLAIAPDLIPCANHALKAAETSKQLASAVAVFARLTITSVLQRAWEIELQHEQHPVKDKVHQISYLCSILSADRAATLLAECHAWLAEASLPGQGTVMEALVRCTRWIHPSHQHANWAAIILRKSEQTIMDAMGQKKTTHQDTSHATGAIQHAAELMATVLTDPDRPAMQQTHVAATIATLSALNVAIPVAVGESVLYDVGKAAYTAAATLTQRIRKPTTMKQPEEQSRHPSEQVDHQLRTTCASGGTDIPEKLGTDQQLPWAVQGASAESNMHPPVASPSSSTAGPAFARNESVCKVDAALHSILASVRKHVVMAVVNCRDMDPQLAPPMVNFCQLCWALESTAKLLRMISSPDLNPFTCDVSSGMHGTDTGQADNGDVLEPPSAATHSAAFAHLVVPLMYGLQQVAHFISTMEDTDVHLSLALTIANRLARLALDATIPTLELSTDGVQAQPGIDVRAGLLSNIWMLLHSAADIAVTCHVQLTGGQHADLVTYQTLLVGSLCDALEQLTCLQSLTVVIDSSADEFWRLLVEWCRASITTGAIEAVIKLLDVVELQASQQQHNHDPVCSATAAVHKLTPVLVNGLDQLVHCCFAITMPNANDETTHRGLLQTWLLHLQLGAESSDGSSSSGSVQEQSDEVRAMLLTQIKHSYESLGSAVLEAAACQACNSSGTTPETHQIDNSSSRLPEPAYGSNAVAGSGAASMGCSWGMLLAEAVPRSMRSAFCWNFACPHNMFTQQAHAPNEPQQQKQQPQRRPSPAMRGKGASGVQQPRPINMCCSRCKVAFFCCRGCQCAAWSADGHKQDCSKML